MAQIYIEQYATLAEDSKGADAQIPGSPLGAEPCQKVTIAASSARQTTALDASAKFVVITADADCQFEVGTSTVTADTNSRPLWSGTYRAVELKGTETHIAVIEKQ